MMPIIEIGYAASATVSREFLFDDEERANRAKALRPKPKEGTKPRAMGDALSVQRQRCKPIQRLSRVSKRHWRLHDTTSGDL